MVYKEKIQSLIQTLEAKINIIQNVANGKMRLDANQLDTVLNECKSITDRISELISIER
jgi:hypothetical protein